MLKKILKAFKLIGISILTFGLLIGIYWVSAYFLSRISVNREKETKNEVSIFIITNGVHTDLVMPVRNEQIDWSKKIKFENTIKKDTVMKYIALGWGDKGFYLETPTWADLKFSTAFKAAFALSSSAIHATFYKEMKEGKNCVKINISKEQYSRLIKYIQSSFKADLKGHYINIKSNANYGVDDTFYEANGSYSLFHTCNTWANTGLKKCGQKACLWTPFDTGIFYQYGQSN